MSIEEKKKELQNDLKVIHKIFFEAKTAYEYALYFWGPSSFYESYFLEKTNEINFISFSLWKISIIDLVKLISESKNRDKYSLINLLNKFKKVGHYGDLKFSEKKAIEF